MWVGDMEAGLDVAVIGLGHLGLPLAALLAQAGHRVRGIDSNPEQVARLRRGEIAWHEPGLAELLRAVPGLEFAADAAAAGAAEVSIVAVPTPSDAAGAYDATAVLDAVAAIGRGLAGHHRAHVAAVLSTVMPGTLDGQASPMLQRLSGRTLGATLGLCYCPAFGALGSLLDDHRQPDFVLIGQSDAAAGDVVAGLPPPSTAIARRSCGGGCSMPNWPRSRSTTS